MYAYPCISLFKNKASSYDIFPASLVKSLPVVTDSPFVLPDRDIMAERYIYQRLPSDMNHFSILNQILLILPGYRQMIVHPAVLFRALQRHVKTICLQDTEQEYRKQAFVCHSFSPDSFFSAGEESFPSLTNFSVRKVNIRHFLFFSVPCCIIRVSQRKPI